MIWDSLIKSIKNIFIRIDLKRIYIFIGGCILVVIFTIISTFNYRNIISQKLQSLQSYLENHDINNARAIAEDYKNNNRFMENGENIIINYCEKYEVLYDISKIELDTYIGLLEIAIDLDINKEKYVGIIDEINTEEGKSEKLLLSNEAYKKGNELLENEEYTLAIKEFGKVIEEDNNYNLAKENIIISELKLREKKIVDINTNIDNKEFDLATNNLQNLVVKYGEDDELITLKSYINTEKLKYEEACRIAEEKRKEEERLKQEKAEIERKEKAEKERYTSAKNLIEDNLRTYYTKNGSNSNIILVDNGEININGVTYYSFFNETNGFSGDSMQVVNKSTMEHYIYYSDGKLISYEEWSKPKPKAITIAELNKACYKYGSQLVEVTGEIVFIKEDGFSRDLLLMNRNGQYVHVKYVASTEYVKGDIISASGYVIGTTIDYTWFGHTIEIPSLSLGKLY